MVNDIKHSLHLLSIKLPESAKIIIYETCLTDEVAKNISSIFSVNFKLSIKCAGPLSSNTSLLANKVLPKLICYNLINTLFLTNSQVNDYVFYPDQLNNMFNQNPNHGNYIDKSGCHMGDIGLGILSSHLTSKLHLTSLKISGNNLSLALIKSIIGLLCHRITEQFLITGNELTMMCLMNHCTWGVKKF